MPKYSSRSTAYRINKLKPIPGNVIKCVNPKVIFQDTESITISKHKKVKSIKRRKSAKRKPRYVKKKAIVKTKLSIPKPIQFNSILEELENNYTNGFLAEIPEINKKEGTHIISIGEYITYKVMSGRVKMADSFINKKKLNLLTEDSGDVVETKIVVKKLVKDKKDKPMILSSKSYTYV